MSQVQIGEFLIGLILVCTFFNGLLTAFNLKMFTEFVKQRLQEQRERPRGGSQSE